MKVCQAFTKISTKNIHSFITNLNIFQTVFLCYIEKKQQK